MNSISHKNYAGSTPIQISVYKDKIMIWNFGELPEDWTIERLLAKHPSIPYNPDIANTFFRSGYVEAWGRGFTKMIELCQQAGLPDPVYENSMSGFWAVFRKDKYHAEYLQELGLNERQSDALLFFKYKGEMVNSTYAKRYQINDRTARRDLIEMVEKGLLIKQGDKKSTRYLYC